MTTEDVAIKIQLDATGVEEAIQAIISSLQNLATISEKISADVGGMGFENIIDNGVNAVDAINNIISIVQAYNKVAGFTKESTENINVVVNLMSKNYRKAKVAIDSATATTATNAAAMGAGTVAGQGFIVAIKGIGAAIKSAMLPLLVITAAVVVLTTATEWLTGAEERRKKAHEETAAALKEANEVQKDAVSKTQSEIDSVEALVAEYEELKSKTSLTAEEKQRLLEVEYALAQATGSNISFIGDEATRYGTLTEATKAYLAQKREELALNQQKAAETAMASAEHEVSGAKKTFEKKRDSQDGWFGASAEDVATAAAEYEAQAKTAYSEAAQNIAASIVTSLSDGMGGEQDRIAGVMGDFFMRIYDNSSFTGEEGKIDAEKLLGGDYAETIKSYIEGIDVESLQSMYNERLAQITDAEGNVDVEGYKTLMEDMGKETKEALTPLFEWASPLGMTITDMEYLQAILLGVVDDTSGIAVKFAEAGDAAGSAAGEVDTVAQAVSNLNAAMSSNGDAASALETTRDKYREILEAKEALNTEAPDYAEQLEALEVEEEALVARYEIERELLQIKDEALEKQIAELENMQEETLSREEYLTLELAIMDAEEERAANAELLGQNIEQTETAAEAANKALEGVTANIKKMNVRIDTNKALTELAKEAKKTGKGLDNASSAVKAFAKENGLADASIDDVIDALEKQGSTLSGERSAMVSNLQTMRNEMIATGDIVTEGAEGILSVDGTPLFTETDDAIAYLEMLIGLLNQGEGAAQRSGGGGGGGKKKDAEEEARKAAEEAARAQEEAYQNQLRQIENKRKRNEITAQEEIELLEEVKRNYAKTAEQIMDIDERIYDARQALREAEQDKLDDLHEGVMDALEARYEEQREAEQARIDESISAWEKWADETCAAIQAQIDALDEKAKAEDREAQAAEKTRKIDNIQQQMLFETDEYNLRQLQKQLEKAQEDWESLQSKWELEDKKAELKAQMDAVQAEADKNIEALEAESESIDAHYDKLTDSMSLAAEAQRLMMKSSQKEIIDLIAAYAPEYNATGQSFGEQFYDGFVGVMGNITDWYENFSQTLGGIQQAAIAELQDSIDAAHASGDGTASVTTPTVVNQTINFNTPVETPADTYNRVQEANEQLVGLLG